MAKINVQSGGAAPLDTGILQLASGAAMSSTLTAVTDQANTASPLLLSTTAVQVQSTLRITTDSNPYIDAEDGSTNNRFTVGRAPASQQVNVDFASNPGGATEVVGAIRTYANGSTLSETLSFLRNGNIGVGTLTQTARLQIKGNGSTSATTSLLVQNSGGNRTLEILDDGNLFIGATASGLGVINVPHDSGYGERVFMKIQNGVNLLATNSNDGLVFKANYNIFNNAIYNYSGQFYGFNTGSGSNTIAYNLPQALLPYATADSQVLHLSGGGRLQGGASGQYFKISGTMILDSPVNMLKGFLFSPTLTGAYSTTNVYAFQSTYGGAYFNTSSPNASAILQADSTTQGFLPPRMTNAQRLAIATPAVGLMVYCTDAVEGLYIYKSTGWTFVI